MRCFIGIDLGTTNTTVSWIAHSVGSDSPVAPFRVPQFLEPGISQELVSFPSEAYLLTRDEGLTSRKNFLFPWAEDSARMAMGAIARSFRSRFSERVVISAKSWLAERSVDPRAAILPWGVESVDSSEKVSALAVTTELLRQIRLGWNATFAGEQLFEKQQIVITTPASFDEAAVALTREAALAAGYPASTRLLEEPQAALLAWIGSDRKSKLTELTERAQGRPYQLLVCDVGGGTTDLSLFELSNSNGQLQVKRKRVSDHILLGGDNIDLAVALELEQRINSAGTQVDSAQLNTEALTTTPLTATRLTATQWRFLLTESRRIKEAALNESTLNELALNESTAAMHVSIPGAGSSLFAGAVSVSVPRQEIIDLIIHGFFPACSADDSPMKSSAGLRQSGLDFAHDPAVTKHIAAFVRGLSGERTVIDGVLFNGGTLQARRVREQILRTIGTWQSSQPQELLGADVEFGVSRGAALSAMEQGTLGRSSIEGGAARALFLAVAGAAERDNIPLELVCVLPRGAQDGETFVIQEPAFAARFDVPVQFQVFGSRESNANVGDVVAYDERSFLALPPLQTLLRSATSGARRKAREAIQRVVIVSELDHVGRLRLALRAVDDERELGELRFHVRDSRSAEEGSQPIETVVFPGIEAAAEVLARFYGKKGESGVVPKRLFDTLESQLMLPRQSWPAGLCRQLWRAIYPGITRRGRSLEHEVNWLNLAGFLLRPGYGVELDSVRIEELFELQHLGLAFPKEVRSQIQYWILWRRVAGGLDAQQQQRIYEHGRMRISKSGSELPEIYRALASLERLAEPAKLQLIEDLIARLRRRPSAGEVDFVAWALMRLLAREPLYAGRHLVLPRLMIEETVADLLRYDLGDTIFQRIRLPLLSAVQFVGDPGIDVDITLRERALTRLEQVGVEQEQLGVARVIPSRSETDEARLFGESLPLGLVRHFAAQSAAI